MRITSAVLVAEALARIPNLSPEEAFHAVQSGGSTMLDIRETEELALSGSVPGALHIPRGLLEFAVDPGHPVYRSEITHDTPLIVMSAGGHRSALATETLQTLGFSQVANLRGGFRAWVGQGLPTVYPSVQQAT